jgi:hypothetical protein
VTWSRSHVQSIDMRGGPVTIPMTEPGDPDVGMVRCVVVITTGVPDSSDWTFPASLEGVA